jgi:hypothetical protein
VHDKLKLLSSLNTLGYIKFDVLCNLDDLEEKLSFSVDLNIHIMLFEIKLERRIYGTSSIYLFKSEISFCHKTL